MKLYLNLSLVIFLLQLVTFTTAEAVTREELAKIEFLNFDLTESANFKLFQTAREGALNKALADSEVSRFYKSFESLARHGRDVAHEIKVLDVSQTDKSKKIMSFILRLEMASKNLLLDPFMIKNLVIIDQVTKDQFSKIDTSKSDFIDSFESFNKMMDNAEIDIDRIGRSTDSVISLLNLVSGEVNMIYSSKDSSSIKFQKMMEVLLRLNFACELLLKKPLLDKQADAESLTTQ